MTQEKSNQKNYPISNLCVAASLAKVFQSLEKGVDSPIQGELCSLKLPELPPLKNLNICCLKTFPVSYRMTKAGRLQPSSVRWMNWGMSDNLPYQKYVDRGYFSVKETVFETSAMMKTHQQTLVTGKGQRFIIGRLKKEYEEMK